MTAADTAERGMPPQEEGGAAPGAERDLLTFTLGETRFGVWVDELLEIVRTPPITRLPLGAPDVAGITSIRGVVVPVLDLGERLLGRAAARPGRLVLIRHHDSGSLVALLVDGVRTLLTVAAADLRPAPAEAEARLPPGYVTGVVAAEDGVVTVLHLGEAAAPPGTSTEE